MKQALSFLLAHWLVAVVGAAGAQAAQAPQNLPLELSVTIRPVKDTVQAGSAVEVETTFKNESDHPIPYGVSDGRDYTRFDVRDSAGNQPLTPFGRAVLLGEGLGPDDFPPTSAEAGVLEPHESTTLKQRISAKVFDLTEPGSYSIQLREPWRHQSIILSNTITVKVVQGATPYVAPVPQPPISVTIQAVGGASVITGRKVAIKVITKNISNHWLNEQTAEDKRDLQRFFRVDVQDGQGATPPETDFGQRVGNRGDAPFNPWSSRATPGRGSTIGPSYGLGEERTQVIAVNDLYDLSKPGQYTIQVRRWDDETKTWVKSNTITVTVTP
jgi:hypothetical protein